MHIAETFKQFEDAVGEARGWREDSSKKQVMAKIIL